MTIKEWAGPRATLIGDVVGSRRAGDRRAAHRALTAALERLNAQVPATSPLRVIAGDEFQGAYAALGSALDVALRVRLLLLEDEVDLRLGVGWGPTSPLDDAGVEDGPGWWAARAAIEEVADRQGRAASRSARTAFRAADETPRPEAAAVEAALRCRDHLLGLCDTRSRRILRGLMDGTTQLDLARAEGITAQAVSQRVAHDGLAVLAAASAELARLP